MQSIHKASYLSHPFSTRHLGITVWLTTLLMNHTAARSLTGCGEVVMLRLPHQIKPYNLEITPLTQNPWCACKEPRWL